MHTLFPIKKLQCYLIWCLGGFRSSALLLIARTLLQILLLKWGERGKVVKASMGKAESAAGGQRLSAPSTAPLSASPSWAAKSTHSRGYVGFIAYWPLAESPPPPWKIINKKLWYWNELGSFLTFNNKIRGTPSVLRIVRLSLMRLLFFKRKWSERKNQIQIN